MKVSFKTAKLAKERGVNIPLDIYNDVFDLEDKQPMFNVHRDTLLSSKTTWISRPTQSELQKWLREEHNLNVDIIAYYDEKDLPLSKDRRPKPLGYFAWDYYNEDFCEANAPKFEKYEDALEYDLFNKLELI